ncbi:hypothetical protein NpNSSI1_00008243 [Neofusicoccum parvum]|nr:hypothetical protein NpNSSI1_00008243 [Neofusicoccum parvum]
MTDTSYIAHEERVKEAKANWEARRRQGPRQSIVRDVRDHIYKTLIDPCRFVLPKILVNAPPDLEGVDAMSGPERLESMTPPVVRSSQSHTFSLLEAIRESANSVAPRGFKDLPSEKGSNVLTDEIKAAFEQDSKIESAPAFFMRITREAARNNRDTSKARHELEAIRDLVAPLTDPYAPNDEDVS